MAGQTFTDKLGRKWDLPWSGLNTNFSRFSLRKYEAGEDRKERQCIEGVEGYGPYLTLKKALRADGVMPVKRGSSSVRSSFRSRE